VPTIIDGDFEWDDEKSVDCLERWGFGFEIATSLLSQGRYLEDFDDQHDDEDRFVCIGYVGPTPIRVV
jgi:uncharacterized DUF497 family protein